jgi:hypothetical protein
MKKQLLKLTLIVAVFLGASATYAQADLVWTQEGWYKIGARGTNLFMTIDMTGALVWAEELPDNAETQLWAIVNHRTPASNGLMEITAKAGGLDWTLTTSSGEDDHPNYTLVVEQRLPKEVAYTPAAGEDSPAVFSGDRTGLDQFQRRKAKVDENGDPDPNGANPAGVRNNALFLQTPWGTNSRFGVTPTEADQPVQFDGGGIDVIDFHFVREIEEETASVNTFGANSFSISNPVNTQLIIKGNTSKVNQVVVYSVIGKKVLSKSVKDSEGNIDLDVSALSTGLYILKMTGKNGEEFSKKIIKQ